MGGQGADAPASIITQLGNLNDMSVVVALMPQLRHSRQGWAQLCNRGARNT